jgi:anaerobic selenocysteine-containing dehydrogenase
MQWYTEQHPTQVCEGRITHPMIKRPGATQYEPVDWDEAFGVIAPELHALDHPNEAVFYTSGRTYNEAAFAYQLFVRAFGTNNLPDTSNMCHESTSGTHPAHRLTPGAILRMGAGS